MCEDIAGGSDMSAGGTFFREIQRPFRWVPAVRSSQKMERKSKTWEGVQKKLVYQ